MSGGEVRPTCPNGGIWHICLTAPSQFVGCCKSNPCSNPTGCPDQDVTAASFEPSSYGDFPDQNCGANQGKFYTCTFPGQNIASFIGCCRSDPCMQSGCPAADLGAAVVNSAQIQPFITAVGGLGVMSFATTSTTSTQTSISSITSSFASTTSTRSSSSTSSTDTSSSDRNSSSAGPTANADPFSGTTAAGNSGQVSKGLIAGVTIAAVVLFIGIFAILFFICTRRRRMEQQLESHKKSMIEDEPVRTGMANVSSGGLFSPERARGSRVIATMPGPTYAAPIPRIVTQDNSIPPGNRTSYIDDPVNSGRGAVGNDHPIGNPSPAGRYYMTPSPSNYSRASPAPPYDMQQRGPISPSFPPHPAISAGLTQTPYSDNDAEERQSRMSMLDHQQLQQAQLHQLQQQQQQQQQHTRHSSGVGYAVPMLPQDQWPATSLATVHEITSDGGETPTDSTRSSGTFMVAAGQRTTDPSPKRGSVARDYAASVMLARSPPPAERDSGRWSNGVPRRKSLVGEVYDNLRDPA